MTTSQVVIAELQKLAPSAIIELFELQLVASLHGANTIYRFHAGTNNLQQNLVWDGNTYTRFPIEAGGFEYNSSGSLPRPRIRVANVLSTVTAILLSVNSSNPGNDLSGAKVTRIRTLAKFLDAVNFPGGVNASADPTAVMPAEVYYIDRKVTENREIVEFELASSLDLVGMRLPRRQTIQNICQWKYKGTECGWNPPDNGGNNASFEMNRKTGTYTQTSGVLTISINNHGFTNGQRLRFDFTSGTAIDGIYTVTNASTNSFTPSGGGVPVGGSGSFSRPYTTGSEGEIYYINPLLDITMPNHGFTTGQAPYFQFTWSVASYFNSDTGETSYVDYSWNGALYVTVTSVNTFQVNLYLEDAPSSYGGNVVATYQTSGNVTVQDIYINVTTDFSHGLSTGDELYTSWTGFSPAVSNRSILVSASGSQFVVENIGQFIPISVSGGSVGFTQLYDLNDQPTFSSAVDNCAKRLASCSARFGAKNDLPFGSFPGVGQSK